jgi:hypothetical protein
MARTDGAPGGLRQFSSRTVARRQEIGPVGPAHPTGRVFSPRREGAAPPLDNAPRWRTVGKARQWRTNLDKSLRCLRHLSPRLIRFACTITARRYSDSKCQPNAREPSSSSAVLTLARAPRPRIRQTYFTTMIYANSRGPIPKQYGLTAGEFGRPRPALSRGGFRRRGWFRRTRVVAFGRGGRGDWACRLVCGLIWRPASPAGDGAHSEGADGPTRGPQRSQ